MSVIKKNKVLVVAATILGIPASVATIFGTVHSFESSQPKPPIVSENASFRCAQMPDPKHGGGQVWTVMYSKNSKLNPWLKMVRSMGNGWDTSKRCQEIAKKMDTYRQDGLMALEYRKDDAVPGQYVICAKTKISGEACSLVLTLMPTDDPYLEQRKVLGALMGGDAVEQNSQNKSVAISPIINIADQL